MELHEDRYLAARLDMAWSNTSDPHVRYGLNAQLSQGLGDLGGITRSEAIGRGIPLSRQNATPGFTKLALAAQGGATMGQGVDLSVRARGQTSFGNAMLRAEQFAMEGPDGLSAYVGGVTAVDEGVVIRTEIARPISLGPSRTASRVAIAPYGFVAVGTGRLASPTALEKRRYSAANLGAGLRAEISQRISLTAEYARGNSNYRLINKVDRMNFGIALRF